MTQGRVFHYTRNEGIDLFAHELRVVKFRLANLVLFCVCRNFLILTDILCECQI
jgi:hypothetical protein